MSACAQCGTAAKPGDKFCNVCGTPIVQAPAPYGAPGQPGFAPPAPPPGAFGAPPPQAPFGPPPGQGGPRCQMGHEIPPGGSYCAQGHPIALDQMQFAGDPYAAPGYGAPQPPGYPPPGNPYGAPPPPPGAPFGAPPPAYGYGAPQPGYAPPAAPAPGFGPPPAAPGFGPAAQPPYPAPGDTPRDAVPAKILRGFLVAYGANPGGDFWPLTGGRLTVGRLGSAEGIDVSLQDPTISSRHAAMVVDAASGTITVEDTGSTNGTFVNDEHIGFNGRRDLRDGDRLRFGGFTTIVKVIGRQ
jgi:hypothetical protein